MKIKRKKKVEGVTIEEKNMKGIYKRFIIKENNNWKGLELRKIRVKEKRRVGSGREEK